MVFRNVGAALGNSNARPSVHGNHLIARFLHHNARRTSVNRLVRMNGTSRHTPKKRRTVGGGIEKNLPSPHTLNSIGKSPIQVARQSRHPRETSMHHLG